MSLIPGKKTINIWGSAKLTIDNNVFFPAFDVAQPVSVATKAHKDLALPSAILISLKF